MVASSGSNCIIMQIFWQDEMIGVAKFKYESSDVMLGADSDNQSGIRSA